MQDNKESYLEIDIRSNLQQNEIDLGKYIVAYQELSQRGGWKGIIKAKTLYIVGTPLELKRNILEKKCVKFVSQPQLSSLPQISKLS